MTITITANINELLALAIPVTLAAVIICGIDRYFDCKREENKKK